MAEPEQSPADLVRATASLARLELADAEAAELGGQLEHILSAFRTLAEADVEGVPPMIGPSEQPDVLRPDRASPARDRLGRDALLRSAPQREGEFFGVPKTIGGPQ
jgi:aspartyl-tRNA(Asn)/glutamyl-tRNA(Gln) amidotransferase subunit C